VGGQSSASNILTGLVDWEAGWAMVVPVMNMTTAAMAPADVHPWVRITRILRLAGLPADDVGAAWGRLLAAMVGVRSASAVVAALVMAEGAIEVL
jgi:hypothetical protein